MISYSATILKFDKKGEKTGWTYISIPADLAQQLKKGNKKSFRVKGLLDSHPIEKTAILPMGDGEFILPLNASMRKAIGKKHGSILSVKLTEDKSEFTLNEDLMQCLHDEPEALKFFKSLPGSHQKYFSNWVSQAKTEPTRAKRIAMTINAMLTKMHFGQMLREAKNKE